MVKATRAGLTKVQKDRAAAKTDFSSAAAHKRWYSLEPFWRELSDGARHYLTDICAPVCQHAYTRVYAHVYTQARAAQKAKAARAGLAKVQKDRAVAKAKASIYKPCIRHEYIGHNYVGHK